MSTAGPLADGRLSSISLLARLRRQGRQVLSFPEDWGLIDGWTKDRGLSEHLITELLEGGGLVRVRRGAYVLRSPAGTLDIGAMDLVGELTPQAHLVTGGAALGAAGLLDQGQRHVVVLVSSGQRPWTWLGQEVVYARVRQDRIWGSRALRSGAERSTKVALPERAILDSIAHPVWGVTLSQAAQALERCLSENTHFSVTLAQTTARYGNALLARRIGYLVEHIAGYDAARPFLALRGTSHRIVPLDASSPDDATVKDTTWGVAPNVEIDLLLEPE